MADPVLPPEMWGLWDESRRMWLVENSNYVWFKSHAKAVAEAAWQEQMRPGGELIPVRLFPRDAAIIVQCCECDEIAVGFDDDGPHCAAHCRMPPPRDDK